MNDPRFDRFRQAYTAMGFSLQEATTQAETFLKEDDAMIWPIGCSDFETNRALVFTIEAARALCDSTDGRAAALRLLQMAVAEIKKL